MRGKDLNDIEKSLERLVPRPAPPGLGRRVVDRALDSRMNAAVTPRLRTAALVCAALALVALIGDAVVSKRQSGRIAVLRGGPGITSPARVEEEVRLLWAEVGGDLGDLDKFLRAGSVQARLESRGGSERAYLKVREMLKGMTDNEDQENYY